MSTTQARRLWRKDVRHRLREMEGLLRVSSRPKRNPSEAHGRRKRVQEQAEADPGKAHQVCHTRAGVHVFDRLPGAVPQGCYHAIGAGAVSKSERFNRERI